MNGFDTLRRRIFAAFLFFVSIYPALEAQTLRPTPRSAAFVENRGQWSGPGRYLARYGGLDLWVTDNALVYDFRTTDATQLRGHVVRMEFVGASGARAVRASEAVVERHNYLTGGSEFRKSIEARAYEQVAIRGIMPGVDAVTYDDDGHPRYDIHVAAGVDASTIRLRFSGADRLSIGDNGGLIIGTSLGVIEQRELHAFQIINDKQRTVGCRFVLEANGDVSFALSNRDMRYPLIIDPLTYSTFLGGVNDDIANGIAVDSSGNAYLVGETMSPDFPYTNGAYFGSLQGTSDAFVTKLSSDGTTRVFSTFIGGTDIDVALDVAVSRGGNVYVAGWTASSDFPARGGYDSTYNGAADAFVLRLDSAGRSLTFSNLLGGSADDRATAIAVDSLGRIYVAGFTLSSSFPTTPGAYQNTAGAGEAFALKLGSNGRTLLYSTFIGGDAYDEATDIAIRHGIAYVAGITESDGTTGDPFPTSTGAMQPSFGGLTDGFVTAVDSNGRGVLYSTLIGAAGIDIVRAIAVDRVGAAYITGGTESSAFPTTGGAFQNVLNGQADAFVAKIGPDGSALNYSTYVGGGSIESGEAIGVTSEGLALVAGNTTSGGFPTTIGALQTSISGGQDMFVIELSAFSYSLIYGSFLGGTGNDSLRSAAFVGATTVYLAGTTNSIDYPTTTDAASRIPAGGLDAFATRFDILQVTVPNTRATFCAGSTQRISWTGGSSVNYDVSISANNGVTWTPIAFSVSGNSYMWAIPAQQTAGNAYRVRVTVAGGGEGDASDSTFTIIARPTILTNPSSITRAEGSTVTFSSRGTGSEPVVWQRSTDRGVTWTIVPSSTPDQLTVENIAASDDSTLYRALYSNQCEIVATQPARLTVQAVRVLTPSGGEVFCLGSTQTITFSRQHVDAVHIELSTNGGTNWSSIATNVTGNSYVWTIPTSLRPGGDFRIRVVQAIGSARDASDVSFSIQSPPSVVQSPSNETAEDGSFARFTVAGDAFPGFSVQWQILPAGSSEWVNIPDATVGTLVVGRLAMSQNGSQYRAVLTNACGADTSGAATLTVIPAAGIQTGSASHIGLVVQPNPATDATVVRYSTRRAAHARMVVYDARGNAISTLLDARVEAGEGRVVVDTRTFANGAYRVVLQIDDVAYTTAFNIVR